jgi:hypothetical protein
MLQHAQAVSILRHVVVVGEGLSRLDVLLGALPLLRCVVAIGEGSSRLDIFLGALPLSLFDMLFTAREGSRT